MNYLIKQADELLKNHGFEYAFCGGWAIDLFIEAETRKHSDIDIHAYWQERNTIILYMQSLGFEVYEMLGGGMAHHITDIYNQIKSKRNIFCCKPDCELVCLSPEDKDGICGINFQHIGQTKLNFLEFLFNDKSENTLIYARNHEIKQPLTEAILYSDNIPYLSPEFCILYKSNDTERDGYQHDYYTAMTKMNEHQKQWLINALDTMYPQGHKWRL
ncbi:MAG: hypothetical protein VB118_02800 [Oscillospiraceae bacterium]|nr:hypothetical protein [Oscillospiraceae bacterium]